MINPYFQYYKDDIHSSNPAGWVTLDQFIRANKEPKPHIEELFNQIAYYSSIGDNETKAKLKERLFSFTPCVQLKGRRKYSSIAKFTGLMVLDFDKIHNAIDFKDYLFNEYNSIIACWLSPSKMGVKALVNIPVVTSTDEFKEYFFGIAEEMWQYNGFDGSPQNCVLPLFQSWDPDLFQRENPTQWIKKGIRLQNFTTSTGEVNPVEGNVYYDERIYKIIDTGMSRIHDNGHPQLRALCVAIGGYVANGYITKDKVLNMINYKIELHPYLKKGIKGYQNTAREMIEFGITKPLSL